MTRANSYSTAEVVPVSEIPLTEDEREMIEIADFLECRGKKESASFVRRFVEEHVALRAQLVSKAY